MGYIEAIDMAEADANAEDRPIVAAQQDGGLQKLADEYRKSMDTEILHSWAVDVVDAIRASPSQVAPTNPAQVTGSMKRDFAKWLEEQPGAVSMYQAYRAGRITAIGAGGQAVAIISKAEAKLAAYAFDEDEEAEFSREDAVFVLSALSRPHTADERVVEALRRMLSLFDDQGNLIADFAQMQGAIGNAYQALAAKEAR